MLQLSPSHRVCLSNPSPDSVKVCGMACWLYHALKIGHRDEIDVLIQNGSFADLCARAHDLLALCPLLD